VKDPEIIQPPGKEADLPPMPQNPPLLNNVPLQNRIEVEVVDISEETDVSILQLFIFNIKIFILFYFSE